MKISELLNVPADNLDFYDMDLEQDTKLFLEPGLIQTLDDDMSHRAQAIIDDYFDALYAAYRRNASTAEKAALVAHVKEPNYTKLGYGNGNNGKAKTPQGMLEVFQALDPLYQLGLEIRSPLDLNIFLKKFAEDCLSDLLTNLLADELSHYTYEQCVYFGVDAQYFQKPKKKVYYWCIDTHTWEQSQRPQLIIDDRMILFVPKHWLRTRIYCGTNHFIRQTIIERFREERTIKMDNGKISRPLVKDINTQLHQQYGSAKDIALYFARKNPFILRDYHKNVSAYYHKHFAAL